MATPMLCHNRFLHLWARLTCMSVCLRCLEMAFKMGHLTCARLSRRLTRTTSNTNSEPCLTFSNLLASTEWSPRIIWMSTWKPSVSPQFIEFSKGEKNFELWLALFRCQRRLTSYGWPHQGWNRMQNSRWRVANEGAHWHPRSQSEFQSGRWKRDGYPRWSPRQSRESLVIFGFKRTVVNWRILVLFSQLSLWMMTSWLSKNIGMVKRRQLFIKSMATNGLRYVGFVIQTILRLGNELVHW